MNTDLAIKATGQGSIVPANDEMFKSFAESGFLANLRLQQGQSGPVADGKATIGDFVLFRSKEDYVNLGQRVEVMVITFRYKAMIFGDQVVSYFDPNSADFKAVRQRAEGGEKGVMCGVEFLLWVPAQNCFATFYMASASMRRKIADLRVIINEKENKPGACEIYSTVARNKKGTWRVLEVKEISNLSPLPTQEDFDAKYNNFVNPASSQVEVDTGEKQDDRG